MRLLCQGQGPVGRADNQNSSGCCREVDYEEKLGKQGLEGPCLRFFKVLRSDQNSVH